MKRFMTSVTAGFAFLASTFAVYAADMTDTVKAMDAATHTVTLSDGKTYAFPATMDLSKVKVGDKVKVTFTTDAAGKNNATAIAPAT